jgi:hypothetical protein
MLNSVHPLDQMSRNTLKLGLAASSFNAGKPRSAPMNAPRDAGVECEISYIKKMEQERVQEYVGAISRLEISILFLVCNSFAQQHHPLDPFLITVSLIAGNYLVKCMLYVVV